MEEKEALTLEERRDFNSSLHCSAVMSHVILLFYQGHARWPPHVAWLDLGMLKLPLFDLKFESSVLDVKHVPVISYLTEDRIGVQDWDLQHTADLGAVATLYAQQVWQDCLGLPGFPSFDQQPHHSSRPFIHQEPYGIQHSNSWQVCPSCWHP